MECVLGLKTVDCVLGLRTVECVLGLKTVDCVPGLKNVECVPGLNALGTGCIPGLKTLEKSAPETVAELVWMVMTYALDLKTPPCDPGMKTRECAPESAVD